MSLYWIVAAILLPILGGALTPVLPFRSRKGMLLYLEALTLAATAIVLSLLAHGTTGTLHLVYFVRGLSISFRIDGLAMLFAGLVSILWPFAMLYSFEYMEHEGHEKIFFMFYSMTYGVTLGVAFASDMLSMYLFYELLTLVTVPLILHTLVREAILAVRQYLYMSLGGAAFALIAIVFLMVYGETLEFTLGGVLNPAVIGGETNLLLFVYLLAFFGFGVKAAIFPMSAWLPQAGVAPTPVTALLHAVAVVKAGVFAILRLTYYSFGAEFLKGTWVQPIVMGFAMFTIVYGCSRAVKEQHIKRRLAYSTVSNLSYIILGASMMTPGGLVGAMAHMICHAFMKIGSFLCAGAIMHQTDKKYIYELNGFGRKMPVVFGCFTVSALGLMGVPGLAGFISKWNLAKAAVESEKVMAYFGVGCLLISALLTAIYMMSIVIRAFFPGREFDAQSVEGVKDPGWKMCFPLVCFAAAVIAIGMCSDPLISFLQDIAAGRY
ncbi:MAG: proton-conducting membrane transporter [Ruminococcus sp.]|nr:Na(+)/H(+) antiporter subunit A [Schaedlerella arabinosiphila]MCI9604760.1 proton-conducting membrane transporter [Ruminococcus sp.]